MKTEFDKCPGCGGKIEYKGQGTTLVAYGGCSAPHDHDDNCKSHMWQCENGCQIAERLQNVCPVPGCDWKGKTDCFCSNLGITIYTPGGKEKGIIYMTISRRTDATF